MSELCGGMNALCTVQGVNGDDGRPGAPGKDGRPVSAHPLTLHLSVITITLSLHSCS